MQGENMKVYVRDGDFIEIELPDGQLVFVDYELPYEHPDMLPQLEITLPQPMRVNLWQEHTVKVADHDAVQIVIPISKRVTI
jgi:hypothetical protein